MASLSITFFHSCGMRFQNVSPANDNKNIEDVFSNSKSFWLIHCARQQREVNTKSSAFRFHSSPCRILSATISKSSWRMQISFSTTRVGSHLVPSCVFAQSFRLRRLGRFWYDKVAAGKRARDAVSCASVCSKLNITSVCEWEKFWVAYNVLVYMRPIF